MHYDATTRTLTLERKDCRACDYATPKGTEATPIPCETCHGTGNGPRGGRGGCRTCHGNRLNYDQINRRPCSRCKGKYRRFDSEDFCDTAPKSVIETLPIVVARANRDISWNESYLGLGCLWSCQDYGTAWEGTDEALLEHVVADLKVHRVQATKIVERYERGATVAHLARGLVIVLSRGGYSVRPLLAEQTVDEVEWASSGELTRDEALMFGTAIYNLGGNGTMAAATANKRVDLS